MTAFEQLRAAHRTWREAVDRYEARFDHALRSGGRFDNEKGMAELEEIERQFVALKQQSKALLPERAD